MSTYEATISLMKGLSENDLLVVNEFVKRLSSKSEENKETMNPFHPLTREEIIEQLSLAHEHADNGMIMDAHKASDTIREKYGL